MRKTKYGAREHDVVWHIKKVSGTLRSKAWKRTKEIKGRRDHFWQRRESAILNGFDGGKDCRPSLGGGYHRINQEKQEIGATNGEVT